MDFLMEIFNKNFDTYFIVLVILGNNIIFDLLPQKLLDFRKSKTYLTIIISILMGAIYFYLDKYFRVEEESVNPKVLLNSFLLSTTLYEMGLKEVISFIKNNGKDFLLKKTAEKMEVQVPTAEQKTDSQTPQG